MDTPTLQELLSDGSFYASVALVSAAMAAVMGLVYVLARRRRRYRRRNLLRYYGPRPVRHDGHERREGHERDARREAHEGYDGREARKKIR